jgi:hypothetical protein
MQQVLESGTVLRKIMMQRVTEKKRERGVEALI